MLTVSEVVNKWGPLVKELLGTIRFDLSAEQIHNVSQFAEKMARDEYATISGSTCLLPGINTPRHKEAIEHAGKCQSLLPINLKVISKIRDLDRITFTHAPFYEDVKIVESIDEEGALCLSKDVSRISIPTLKFKIKVQKDLLDTGLTGNQMIEAIENNAVEFISSKINDDLESKTGQLYVWYPIESIYIKSNTVVACPSPTALDNTDYVEYNINSRWTFKKEQYTLDNCNETIEQSNNII